MLSRTGPDFDAAKYFTYDTKSSACRCKGDMDLDVTRREKTGRISGNVDCENDTFHDTVVTKYYQNLTSLGPLPCYTEDDVLYKAANDGVSALGTSDQATIEDCRDHCRHL